MVMLPGITGDFVRSMPVTVVFTLGASLLVSLTLTPYLTSIFVRGNGMQKPGRGRRLLDGFIDSHYRRVLDFSLRKPAIVLGLATLVFLGSLSLFPVVGVSFFPKAEKPQFIINVDLPEGTSLQRTDSVATVVDQTLSENEYVRHWVTNVGHGNPRIYYKRLP